VELLFHDKITTETLPTLQAHLYICGVVIQIAFQL